MGEWPESHFPESLTIQCLSLSMTAGMLAALDKTVRSRLGTKMVSPAYTFRMTLGVSEGVNNINPGCMGGVKTIWNPKEPTNRSKNFSIVAGSGTKSGSDGMSR
jgi:hypothetical protein